MIERQLSNSGELERGVFEPFYGKYAENKIRSKIVSGVGNPKDFPENIRAEFSVYDDEKNLQHWTRREEVGVFDHIQKAGIPDGGQYIFRYNFFKPSFGSPDGPNLYVQSISSDRQEIRVRPTPEAGERFQNRFINFFRARFQLPGYTSFPNYTKNGKSAFKPEKVDPLRKVVNFGDNLYYHILNWTSVVNTDEDGSVEFQKNGLPDFKKAAVIRVRKSLPDGIEAGDEFWIDSEFSRPYIDRFEIFRGSEATPVNELSGPDFGISLSERRRERKSGFESFEDITDSNPFETSESFLESKINASERTRLNVDYTDFENFIHFSSAERRLENFRFKIQKINQKISELSDLSGIESAGRQETIKREIEELIVSFDAYEQWLFRSESDWSYPKKSNGALHPPDSIEADQWFGEILSDARKYDDRNDSALRKQVPEFVREDPENKDFVLFVDMVGHWFDVNWIYIDHLEHLTDQTEDAFDKESLSSELSRVVAESMGLETYDGFDAEDFFDEVFDSKKIDEIFGSADISRPTQPETEESKIGYTPYQAQQQVWRRLLSNLTHYYKTRGSETSIKLLTSIFGIPSESLAIRESGGTAAAAQESDTDIGKFQLAETTHFLPFVSSQSIEIPWNFSNNFSRPSGFDSIFSAFKEWPKSVELRFRSEYQGGVPIKLFEITGVVSLRVERTELEENNGKLVLETRKADGTRIEAESEEIALFNGRWTNVLFQMRKNEPFFDLFVQQRSPFGNFSTRDQLSLKIDFETALNFFTAQAIHLGGNLNTQQFQKGTPFIGDLDQINLWQETLSGDQFDKHSLAPKRKGVDNNFLPKRDSVFDEDLEFLRRHLHFRTDFSVPQNLSQNPKIKNESVQKSTNSLKGIAIGFSSSEESPWQFSRYKRISFFDPVQIGATSHFNSKIRVENSNLDKPLRPDRSTEKREAGFVTKDSSQVGIFFSPLTSANRDVISEIGIDDVNMVLGNPNDQFQREYHLLNGINRMYWSKYEQPVDVQTYIQYIDQFYDAFFDHVENSIPARSSLVNGVVIEPTILERDREPVPIGNSDVEDLGAGASAGIEPSAEPGGRGLIEPDFLPDIFFSKGKPTKCSNGDWWVRTSETSGIQKPGQIFGQFSNPEAKKGEEKDIWLDLFRRNATTESGPNPFVDFTFDKESPPSSSQGETGEILGTPVEVPPTVFYSSANPKTSDGEEGDIWFKAENVDRVEKNPGVVYNDKQKPSSKKSEDFWFKKIKESLPSEGPLPFPSNVIFKENRPNISEGINGEIWVTPIS